MDQITVWSRSSWDPLHVYLSAERCAACVSHDSTRLTLSIACFPSWVLINESASACRHQWKPNDFIIWANRRVMHSATPTNVYGEQGRLFHLIFLNTTQPVQAASPSAEFW